MLELLSKTVILPTLFTIVLPTRQKTADTSSHDEKQEEEKGPLVVILYMIDMSENIKKFNIRVVFRSRQTLPQHRPGSRLHYR